MAETHSSSKMVFCAVAGNKTNGYYQFVMSQQDKFHENSYEKFLFMTTRYTIIYKSHNSINHFKTHNTYLSPIS